MTKDILPLSDAPRDGTLTVLATKCGDFIEAAWCATGGAWVETKLFTRICRDGTCTHTSTSFHYDDSDIAGWSPFQQ